MAIEIRKATRRAWFRLLNGRAVLGMDPIEPHSFAAPEDARRWALAHEQQVPRGLEITDGRLYARSFYDLTLHPHERVLAAGSLIHAAARTGVPEVWGFEIDHTDPAGVAELRVTFNQLAPVRGRQTALRSW